MSKEFVVQVVEYATEQVVKEIRAVSEPHAESVERGVNINLDHDKYYTTVKATP